VAGFAVRTQDKTLGVAPHDLHRLITDNIKESNCVLHLAGFEYGTDAVEPFPDAPDFRCSWTQFEYLFAHSLDKDVIAFCCDTGLCQSTLEDKPSDNYQILSRNRSAQQLHRDRVQSGNFDGTPLSGRRRTLNHPHPLKTANELWNLIAASVRRIEQDWGEYRGNLMSTLETHIQRLELQIASVESKVEQIAVRLGETLNHVVPQPLSDDSLPDQHNTGAAIINRFTSNNHVEQHYGASTAAPSIPFAAKIEMSTISDHELMIILKSMGELNVASGSMSRSELLAHLFQLVHFDEDRIRQLLQLMKSNPPTSKAPSWLGEKMIRDFSGSVLNGPRMCKSSVEHEARTVSSAGFRVLQVCPEGLDEISDATWSGIVSPRHLSELEGIRTIRVSVIANAPAVVATLKSLQQRLSSISCNLIIDYDNVVGRDQLATLRAYTEEIDFVCAANGAVLFAPTDIAVKLFPMIPIFFARQVRMRLPGDGKRRRLKRIAPIESSAHQQLLSQFPRLKPQPHHLVQLSDLRDICNELNVGSELVIWDPITATLQSKHGLEEVPDSEFKVLYSLFGMSAWMSPSMTAKRLAFQSLFIGEWNYLKQRPTTALLWLITDSRFVEVFRAASIAQI
jgi:hypothetical protein